MKRVDYDPGPMVRVFTTDYVWHYRGPALFRRNLKTYEEVLIFILPKDIQRIWATDLHCIVATGNYELWESTAYEPFATEVRGGCIMTPKRVVFSLKNGDIMSWPYHGNPTFAAHGFLWCASDTRLIYEHEGRKWQNGQPADRKIFLCPDGSVTAMGGLWPVPAERDFSWKQKPRWMF